MPGLAESLHTAFRERLVQIMDQSQHTSADSGGEGAAYEFCQGLDTWERERESHLSRVAIPRRDGFPSGTVGSQCASRAPY